MSAVAHVPSSRSRPSAQLPPPELGLGAGAELGAAGAGFGSSFGHGFDHVRVHADEPSARAAEALGARAFTAGSHIGFARGEFAPQTPSGGRLLAHELAHVAQQDEGRGRGIIHRQLWWEEDVAPAAPVRLTEYEDNIGIHYRVGEAAGPNILTGIERQADGNAQFEWFEMRTGRRLHGTPHEWLRMRIMQRFTLGGWPGSQAYDYMTEKLTAAQVAELGDNPSTSLLRMYQERRIGSGKEEPEFFDYEREHQFVVSAYEGLVYQQALASLDQNEEAVEQLLAAGKVDQFRQYAAELRDAAVVRDELVARKEDIERRMVQSQGFSFGYAGRFVNTLPTRRIYLNQELAPVTQALDFWNAAFPLLTHLETNEITPQGVEAKLREIRQNIKNTRERIQAGALDPMEFDVTRANVAGQLGPRVSAVIAEEDSRRRRSSVIGSILSAIGMIALCFLPGGVFIAAAVGVAIAAKEWHEAIVVGQAANSALHADEGLISQAKARSELTQAVFATIAAVIGVAAASIPALRVGRAFLKIRSAAPELELGAQISVARLVAAHPALLTTARTTSELETLLAQLGRELPFEQVQALRIAAYRAQGVQAPALSRESTEAFLGRVWDQRAAIRGAGTGQAARQAVYDVYSQAGQANPLTRTPQSYMDEIVEITAGRPAGAASLTQRGWQPIAAVAERGGLASQEMQGTFFHFRRAGTDLTQVTQRVYLNVAADRAPQVMRALVRDVVDDAARFPGVGAAKLSGPGAVSGRPDNIVIYAADEAAAQRVVTWARGYGSTNPGTFLREVPPMTQQVSGGISVAMEPVGAGGASFGTVRANVIADALAQTARAGGDRAAFIRRVFEMMERAGIDPAAPHVNLPPAAP